MKCIVQICATLKVTLVQPAHPLGFVSQICTGTSPVALKQQQQPNNLFVNIFPIRRFSVPLKIFQFSSNLGAGRVFSAITETIWPLTASLFQTNPWKAAAPIVCTT